ncbi:Uncharacterized protein dnm_098190 [Desulfonema magnum]|uniref:Uncharacterized protein n=1 Tax=Desulfonema magnum TaxID=45655 RepID=A0A975BZP2_9BACT|nr:Uncharacterized protein dnm_098190 [Desulfonema magnum]
MFREEASCFRRGGIQLIFYIYTNSYDVLFILNSTFRYQKTKKMQWVTRCFMQV